MTNSTPLIADSFDIWTSAIRAKPSAGRGVGKKQEFYGFKKLRQLIFELAVRGTLIPQDSSDQSALQCLEESNQGILDYNQTSDRPVPSGWISLPLGCLIASNTGGGTPSKSNPHYWGGGIPWASVKDIQAGKYIDATIDAITEEGLKNSSSNLIPSHRLLIVTRMGLGKLAINRCPMAINQDLRAIEPISALDLDYGYLLFKSVNLVGKGMTVKGVTLNALHAIEVLLPPLAEQNRIAAKVDDLMALCDQLEQQQENSVRMHDTLVQTLLGAVTAANEREQFAEAWQQITSHFDTLFSTDSSIDQLKQTIMQLAVMGKLVEQDLEDEPAQKALSACGVNLKQWTPGSDPGRYETPVSWCWISFADAGSQRLGKMLDGAKNRGVSKPYLRNTNVQWMRIELDDLKEMRIEEREEDDLRLQRGDLLICEGGEPGRCAIWRDEISEMYFQKALHRVRPHKCILPEYLALNLQVDCRNGVLKTLFTGATIKHLTGRSLSAYSIPIPPFAEQCRIVAKVDELMTLCDRLKASLQAAQATQLNLADNLVETAIRLPALPDTVIEHNPCA